MQMFISNGNPSFQQIRTYQQQAQKTQQLTRAPSALTAPIISRIHNVRPGCNSCGRH